MIDVEQIVDWIIAKAGSVVIAIIVILIGMKLVGMLLKLIKKSFDRSKMEASIAGFLLSGIRILGYILVFLTAASIVGFEVTSFVTILGTASLSIGLALQGALSNLAGGVLILALKPFQVGDYIMENNRNNEGTVVSIDVFYTRLRTHDNKIVVIPNGVLADNSLVNLTSEAKRKVEVKIGITYDTDIQKVRELVLGMLQNDERILQEEPKDVFIDSFDESGMTLGIRAWTATDNYWPVTWSLREQVKVLFDENSIEIPFNKLDVHVVGNCETI